MSRQELYDDSTELYGNGSVSSARAIITDKTKTFVISTLVALNLVATVAMYAQWRTAERESRLLQYYLLELDAKFIAAGLNKPENSIAKREGERK